MQKIWGASGLIVLSGLLLISNYPPFTPQGQIWFALIPALFAARAQPQHAFRLGYGLGLLYFGGTFWWIGYVTALGTAALVAYLALYPALWLWSWTRFFQPSEPLTSPKNLFAGILAASGWVILEWWRGWFLSGFGWNNLGLALVGNAPLRQLASLGGVHLLSWLIVLVNVVGALTLQRFYAETRGRQPMKPHVDFSLTMILVALGYAYGLRIMLQPEPAPTGAAKFTCVQANIPQEVKNQRLKPEDILQQHLDLSVFAQNNQSDVLLWPETAISQGVFLDRELHDAVEKLSHDHSYYFILGSLHREQEKIYNTAMLFEPGWQGFQLYRKNKLVIFGEYVPFGNYLPFLRYLVPYVTGFSSGDGPELFDFKKIGLRAAPLICFEDTLPAYARRASQQNPDLLINLTNDAWFQNSPGAEQHLANAIFRTVELDLPLLRCANSGVTCLISRQGEIITQLKDAEGRRVEVSGVLSGQVTWSPSRPTLYKRYGNWIVLLSAVALVMFTLRRRFLS